MRYAALVMSIVVVYLCACAVALGLPEGRHYELVSPAYKGGYGVQTQGIEAVAMSGPWEGDRVAFGSFGVFAGAPNSQLLGEYLAQRGEGGWATVPTEVPATFAPGAGALHDLTPGLTSALFDFSYPAESSGEAGLSREPVLLRHDLSLADSTPNTLEAGLNFEVAGLPLKRLDGERVANAALLATDAGMCHVFFRTAVAASHEALLPEATGEHEDLYEMTTGAPGCASARTLRLVGVRNTLNSKGEPQRITSCVVELGADLDASEGDQLFAVSADGSEVFFTTNAGSGECNSPSNPSVLYVRLNGERTVQVSKALGEACEVGERCLGQQRAEFAGANEDGTMVFFTTRQSLLAGDTDTGNDLYMATIGCPAGEGTCEPAGREVTSLVQVSHDPNLGEAGEAQGVVSVSPDGGHVYFVARGVLTEEGPVGEGVQSRPVKGADNLYVYDTQSASLHFIGDICSGPSVSGEAADVRCPSNPAKPSFGRLANDTQLWANGLSEAQAAGPSGGLLLFSTYAQLVDEGPSKDSDSGRDVYLYDAQQDSLTRISVGEGEYDGNGNGNGYNAVITSFAADGRLALDYGSRRRAISEDGSRAVFETAEPLSPNASNGLSNAYEWHEGRVALVSNGSDAEAVGSGGEREVVMTPSGRDVFFVTVQGLLPFDADGAKDVYDARLGPGFPEMPAPQAPCSAYACRTPFSQPNPVLVPGSALQTPGENVPSPKAHKKKDKPAKRHKRKRRTTRPRSRRRR